MEQLLVVINKGGSTGNASSYITAGKGSYYSIIYNLYGNVGGYTMYGTWINGITCGQAMANAPTDTTNLTIGRRNTSEYGKNIYYYSFEVKNINPSSNHNVLLIPCIRKSDNEIGFFDKKHNTFYANQGTGTPIAGPNAYGQTIFPNIF